MRRTHASLAPTSPALGCRRSLPGRLAEHPAVVEVADCVRRDSEALRDGAPREVLVAQLLQEADVYVALRPRGGDTSNGSFRCVRHGPKRSEIVLPTQRRLAVDPAVCLAIVLPVWSLNGQTASEVA